MKVHDLPSAVYCKIACSENHSMILTSAGEVFSCGSYAFGKLGLGPIKVQQSKFKQIKSLKNVIQIACGVNHSMALSQTHKDGSKHY